LARDYHEGIPFPICEENLREENTGKSKEGRTAFLENSQAACLSCPAIPHTPFPKRELLAG